MSTQHASENETLGGGISTFSLDGVLSEFTRSAREILHNTTLNTNSASEDSFTIVLYRIDPRDQYHYLVAYAGLRETEPMFGPRVKSDALSHKTIDNSPRGFRSREGITTEEDFCRTKSFYDDHGLAGALWVSRRPDANWSPWEQIEPDMIAALDSLFRNHSRSSSPLYPDLWFEERQARDFLRSAISSLGPWPRMEQVAWVIARSLVQSFTHFMRGQAQVRVGVYLFTGNGWQLSGVPDEPPFLLRQVSSGYLGSRRGFDWFVKDKEKEDIQTENAFEWVHHSGTSVLLKPSLSACWERRIQACGLSIPRTGGTCITPISDPLDQLLSFGLLVVSVSDMPHFGEAHAFLTSRLSQSATGYLARLLPIPGFPLWPDAKLSRGDAQVTFASDTAGWQDSVDSTRNNQIVRIAENLMPTGGRVTIKLLSAGLTPSEVFQLIVLDERKVLEIPRVLKVGPAEIIGDELHRYFTYVHNKIVGGHSRVDIARGYPTMEWKTDKPRESTRSATAAIVYTFVGPGEHPTPWSEWARTAKAVDVEHGIDLVMHQLACWHQRARLEQKSLREVVLTQEILEKQRRRHNIEPSEEQLQLKGPSIQETVDLLKGLWKILDSTRDNVQTCIVHGDPHCSNIFTLQDDVGNLQSVALIDWGKVQSGSHPLTDISILMADLMFRVRFGEDGVEQWGESLLDRWTEKRHCSHLEASVVITVHLLRMLAWRHGFSGSAWISDEAARLAAWRWLKQRLEKDELLPGF